MRIERDFAVYRRSRPAGLELFSDDRSRHGAAVTDQVPAADVINLHWIAGFIDYRTFFAQVPRSRPIVWSLADMNPFTGGCHYDNGCHRFAQTCGSCPQLGSEDPEDLSHRIWTRKRQALGARGPLLHIVAPGRWMADEVRRSSLLGPYRVTVIPTGIDVDVFTPRDRHWCRMVLGIPPEARVVLFVADVVSNVRKGFPLLQRAVAGLPRRDGLFLLSLGHGRPALDLPVAHPKTEPHPPSSMLWQLYSSPLTSFILPAHHWHNSVSRRNT